MGCRSRVGKAALNERGPPPESVLRGRPLSVLDQLPRLAPRHGQVQQALRVPFAFRALANQFAAGARRMRSAAPGDERETQAKGETVGETDAPHDGVHERLRWVGGGDDRSRRTSGLSAQG